MAAKTMDAAKLAALRIACDKAERQGREHASEPYPSALLPLALLKEHDDVGTAWLRGFTEATNAIKAREARELAELMGDA